VTVLIDDYIAGRLRSPAREIAELSTQLANANVVDRNGWRAIDAHERAGGRARGASRDKVFSVAEMVKIAMTESP
jgi:ferredoxin--NADP+ reductase